MNAPVLSADVDRSAGGDALSVFLIAGEPSGDALGADLMRALANKAGRTRFVGVGGAAMEAQGRGGRGARGACAVISITCSRCCHSNPLSIAGFMAPIALMSVTRSLRRSLRCRQTRESRGWDLHRRCCSLCRARAKAK